MTTLDVLSAPLESPWATLSSEEVWLADAGNIGAGEAASIAKRHVGGGKVLRVRHISRGEVPRYKVKVLKPSGRVRVVIVHASTGDVLN